jgi:hypothetical protein
MQIFQKNDPRFQENGKTWGNKMGSEMCQAKLHITCHILTLE